jgi:aminoglycoside 2'-N-acetyltransferase I
MQDLEIKLAEVGALSPAEWAEVLAMCNRAYEEDLESLFETFEGSTHVLGSLSGSIVSHAMWVTRWLQPGNGPLLRTAYVEMVATDPPYQRRGYASQVMLRLGEAITDFDLGGLCPAIPLMYARLGWEFWRGPLFIRRAGRLILTPDEEVMILRLPRTPPLDLEAPLSIEWREGELW